jgi:hypothetical protein
VPLAVSAIFALPASTVVGQIPLIAALRPWSASVLADRDPVNALIAAGSGAVLPAAVIAVSAASWRRERLLLNAWTRCRNLPGDSDLPLSTTSYPAGAARGHPAAAAVPPPSGRPERQVAHPAPPPAVRPAEATDAGPPGSTGHPPL